MLLRLLSILALLISGVGAARAAEPGEVAVAIAKSVLVPRYEALAAALEAQSTAWKAGCGDAAALKTAYNGAADAWAGIEHGRYGPVSRENRPERIAFWPDPRNGTEKGLAALLSAPDEAALAPERMASASVAVQGLPVIERLLYPVKEPGQTAEPSLDARRCAIGASVAANLASIGARIRAEWSDPQTGELAKLEKLAAEAPADPALKSAATQMLTDLATLFQITGDRKLLPLYGGKGKGPQPKAAESWRSGRSERNILLNLEAAEATAVALKPLSEPEAASLVKRLETAKRLVSSHAGNPPGFSGFASVKIAQYEAIQKLPAALGIPLGFNSMDGD